MEDLLAAQLDGKPCIQGMHISVQTILEFLSARNTAEEIREQYPCLQYAARVTGKEISYVMV